MTTIQTLHQFTNKMDRLECGRPYASSFVMHVAPKPRG